MAQPDSFNPFGEFWKFGETLLPPGPMRMFAESLGKGFPFSLGVFDSVNPHLAEATAQFRGLVEACLKLPGELAPTASSTVSDTVTAQLLQKILDPREWLQATGLVDDAVRRVTEAPKLADLWQIEGKYVALMQAWAEARAFSIEHSSHVLGAWAKAASEFTSTLKDKVEKGELRSRREIVNQWVETANRHLIEVQNSAPYLETQRNLLKATTDLHIAQRDLTEYYSEVFGLPTRSEVDDLARMISDLRREVRALRRDQP
jgi:polyhydroxyalkanoate synthase subunit PhaE